LPKVFSVMRSLITPLPPFKKGINYKELLV
jgi:hypothetical protein